MWIIDDQEQKSYNAQAMDIIMTKNDKIILSRGSDHQGQSKAYIRFEDQATAQREYKLLSTGLRAGFNSYTINRQP